MFCILSPDIEESLVFKHYIDHIVFCPKNTHFYCIQIVQFTFGTLCPHLSDFLLDLVFFHLFLASVHFQNSIVYARREIPFIHWQSFLVSWELVHFWHSVPDQRQDKRNKNQKLIIIDFFPPRNSENFKLLYFSIPLGILKQTSFNSQRKLYSFAFRLPGTSCWFSSQERQSQVD